MDLETELARLLHARDLPLPTPDPVPALHAGIRRRRRTQRLQVAASGVAVAVLALGASVVVRDHLGAGTKTQPTAVHPVPDPVAVPQGFEALDVSYTGASTVWALGTVKCSTGYCPLLLASSDGAPWQRRTVPSSEGGGFRNIRFTSDVGYAYGPGLAVTSDGGRTWSAEPVTGDVLALEPVRGGVIRVVSPGGIPSSRVIVERQAVGTSTWKPVARQDAPAVDATVTRLGQRLAVTVLANPAGGGPARSHLLLSNDDGLTWTPREDPCGPASARAQQVSLAPDGVVVALCTDALSRASSLSVSEDSGRTYHSPRPLPARGLLLATAGSAILVSVDDDQLRHRLLRSTDSGRTWTQVASQQSPVARGSEYLAFTTERSGTWIGGDRRRLVRTDDGGVTWKDEPLHR